MLLSELAKSVFGAELVGADGDVSQLVYDSREVVAGSLFAAIVGERFNGHDYLAQVISAGATALVVQADQAERVSPLPVPALVVPNTRHALAPLACTLYQNPTRELYLAGITGTNGKTTTTLLIDSIARAAGDTTGTIGTLGATVAGKHLPHDRTTPEAPDLQRLFREMRGAGATSAAMEVASHALSQGRTEGCAFDVGVFTNLTQDHLDYHGTMDAYRDAKGLLFTQYADNAFKAGKSFVAVINTDDDAGKLYAKQTQNHHVTRTLTYSTHEESAGIRARDVTLGIGSITYTAVTPIGDIPVALPFGGEFNVANSLAAVGYGIARDLSAEVIAQGLASATPVPGRFQPVSVGQDFAVLVDYAHTPDGLENVLRSARPLTTGRLICVFGCGGNRDKTKRPKMGRLAADMANIAIVTSDNPRREEPNSIIADIQAGMTNPVAEVVIEPDRHAAIVQAVRLAQAGDTIVIAGKGHEDYQIIGDDTIHFSDVEEATTALQEIIQ